MKFNKMNIRKKKNLIFIAVFTICFIYAFFFSNITDKISVEKYNFLDEESMQSIRASQAGKLEVALNILHQQEQEFHQLHKEKQAEQIHTENLVGKDNFNQDTTVEYNSMVENPYHDTVPILYLSGGWTELDVGSLQRKNNRKQQLLNISLPYTSDLDHEIVASSQNITAKKNPSYLIYNRVPKCGSSTMNSVIKHLKKQNKFALSHELQAHVINNQQTKNLVNKLKKIKSRKVVYDSHFYYLQWPEFGFNPILINVVRDPIERQISKFYYQRSEKRWGNITERPAPEWFNKTLEFCLFSGDPECQFGDVEELITTYFCGTAWECGDRKSGRALQLAKKHIEEEYSVVGITEDLKNTMVLLENYIPGYFRGASSYFSREKVRENTNSHPPQNDKVVQKLKSELRIDLELYAFIQQRFNIQLQNVNTVKKISRNQNSVGIISLSHNLASKYTVDLGQLLISKKVLLYPVLDY